ncbi:MAG: beta-ketoacyl-[acyl-carrier-protein] synthase family protein [Oscillospiraceae bacterium]|nr:beta-ketoacyl-[acyl-carrier-protein] synthase family protein [Oscillospiraceae bacterium]
MNKKLVITGMGAVTPVGIGVEQYWDGIISGTCGIGEITRIDTKDLPIKTAAEVKGFQPKEYLSSRLASELDTFMQYAYVSAEEAIRDSHMDVDPLRTGIIMGTALGGLSLIGNTQENLAVNGKRVGPRFLSKVMGNIAAAQFSIAHGIKGPSFTVGTACSSGGDAVTFAAMLLSSGAADAMVVMAGESAISPLLVHSLSKAGALSKAGHSRPFDKNRDGFVIGEGGGALILETEEHAEKRGAIVKAELLGCANNTDAHHTVAPDPDGTGAAECIHLALLQSGLRPEEIGYINAHGTATHMGDVAETKAIKKIFGAYNVPVSSTKGATGHLMGAGGITELIACIKAIETGILPPNLHYEEKDAECDLNIIANQPKIRQIKVAMSNALGFGGQNSSVIVGKYMK